MTVHLDLPLRLFMYELREVLSRFYRKLDKFVCYSLSWRAHLNVFQSQLSNSIKSVTPCHVTTHLDCISSEIKSPCQWLLELNCLVIFFQMLNHYLLIHDRRLF